MTTPSPSATPAQPAPAAEATPAQAGAPVAAPTTCCRRPMSTIEVTARGTTLVLHSCSSCGRHLWVRDGQPADRSELLDGVQRFLEEPRPPVRRRRRTA